MPALGVGDGAGRQRDPDWPGRLAAAGRRQRGEAALALTWISRACSPGNSQPGSAACGARPGLVPGS
jgi:hypothetical protein